MLRIYCWEKNQPAKFNKTDYQTLPIILYFTLFLFIYFMAAQKDCPYPIVGLGARLGLELPAVVCCCSDASCSTKTFANTTD